jgi:hypothetical protein
MRREELLPLVARLGRAFAQRGMREHLSKLRLYYLALQKGLIPPSHSLEIHWSERLVLDWLKTLKIPPYESAFELRPRTSKCKHCMDRGEQSWIYTDGQFPGGVRMRCYTCGDLWLEEAE